MFTSKLLGALLLLGVSHTYAQTESPSILDSPPDDSLEDKTNPSQPFRFNLTLKNMHLWRGYRVTDESMAAANVHYVSKNGNFKAGLWGGVGFSGNYTEFDYYMSYSYKQWDFSIWDINNYTDFPNADIFNYDRAETSHFIDVSATYTFYEFPLQLSWSTIVLGRDTYTTTSGELKNAYTNYVEASYVVAEGKNWQLGLYAGAAFSFENESHFYGNQLGLNNIGATYSKSLMLMDDYPIPVRATAM